METEISKLREEISSEDWETSLSAAERLADMGTSESILLLVENLRKKSASIRNAAALGLMRIPREEHLVYLIERIRELGPKEEIGTLVYALECFNCSAILTDIVNLYLNGNFEVRQSANNILNDQSFVLSNIEWEEINRKLQEQDLTLDSFNIRYVIK